MILNPWFWIGLLLAAIACFGSGFGVGHEWRDRSAKLEMSAVVAQAAKEAIQAQKHSLMVTEKYHAAQAALTEANAKARRQIAAVTAKLKKEIAQYVPPQSDAACTVPVGFIRLWNDAGGPVREERATANPPATAGPGSNADASGVALSTVGAGVVEAGDAVQRCQAQVGGLQEHVRSVEAWYSDLVKGLP